MKAKSWEEREERRGKGREGRVEREEEGKRDRMHGRENAHCNKIPLI